MTKAKRVIAIFIALLLCTSVAYASELTANYSDKTGNFVIEGKTAVGDSGKTISVLLIKKEDSSVGHIGMTEVGKDGSYAYKFKLNANPSDYELKLRIDGYDVTGTMVNEIKSFTDSVVMTTKLTNGDGKPVNFKTDTVVNLEAVLKNRFSDNTKITVFSAFYKVDGAYAGGGVVYDGEIAYDNFQKEIQKSISIPSEASEMKLICFAGLTSLKPLNKDKSIENSYGLQFYVSPNGGELSEGTISDPLSLKGARNKIYTLKKNGSLPVGGIVFYLRGGEYDFSNAIPSETDPFLGELSFGANMGGTEASPVSFKAYGDEKPVFTGGKTFEKSEFSVLSESDAMYEKIPLESRGKILTLNLKEQGIEDFGAYKELGNSNADGINDLRIELFADDEPCELAMWPNKTADGYVYAHSTDVLVNANADNESEKATKPVLKIESSAAKRIKNWNLESDDIFCEGWFGYKYFCDSVLVDNFDPDSNELTLSKSVRGGFYDVGRSVLHENKYVKDRNEFRFYNVIEELDSEGEYYIDRNAGVLYFYAPENFKEAGITLAKNKFISLFGGADFITFDGIEFTLGRRGYVNIEKSKNISFKNCVFKNSSYEGMLIGTTYKYGSVQYGKINDESFENLAKNITIENCVFKNLGKGGILAAGGSLRTLERANLTVKNCLFDSCDRIIKNYAPAISFTGVGADINGCIIKNQNGQGIEIGGSDINISYNEFENVTSEACDMGIIYSQNALIGVDITNNYFHDTKWNFDDEYDFCITASTGRKVRMNPAVYIDGYQPGGNVQSNIFENVPVACVMRSYGQKLKNNIFTDVPVILLTSQNNDVYWTVEENGSDIYEANTAKIFKTIADNKEISDVWYIKYPELSKIKSTLDERKNSDKKYPIVEMSENLIVYNELKSYYNESVKNDNAEETLKNAILGYDNAISGGTTFENLIFTDDISIFADLENKDFSLFQSPELMTKAPDIIKIKKANMGRK